MSQSISKPYALLLNPNDFINYEEGAVTLVNYKLEETAMLVESATFRYFVQMTITMFRHISHLRDPKPNFFTQSAKEHFTYMGQIGCVEVKPVNEEHLANITKKSPTWVMHADIVVDFINKILVEENKSAHPLSILSGYMERRIEIKDPILLAIREADPQLFLCLFDSSQNSGIPMGLNRETFDSKIQKTLQIIKETKNDKKRSISQGDLLYISNEDAHLLNNDITYISLVVKMAETVELPKWLIQENCISWAIRRIESIGVVFENIDNQPFSTKVHSYTCHSKDLAETIVKVPSLEATKLAELRSLNKFRPLHLSIKQDTVIKSLESEVYDEKFDLVVHTIEATMGFAFGILALRFKEPGARIGAAINLFGGFSLARRVLQSVDNLKKLNEIKQEVINDLHSSQAQ